MKYKLKQELEESKQQEKIKDIIKLKSRFGSNKIEEHSSIFQFRVQLAALRTKMLLGDTKSSQV